MAYDADELNLLTPTMGLGAGATTQIWSHVSTETVATVIAAGYVDDGGVIGMRVNDIVHVIDTDAPDLTTCLVTVVAADGDVTMIKSEDIDT